MKAQDKPKLFIMMSQQFRHALIKVAERSYLGHKKYADLDQDWQGFTRIPTEEYDDAQLRHLLGIGEPEETELDHLAANAWNALARLELYLRKQNV